MAAGCTQLVVDTSIVASDLTEGRQNNTLGSQRTQSYLISQLRQFAVGLNSSASGDDAFKQAFAGGTNIVAVIPGDELPDEYVIVGAHYDHLGSSCSTAEPADTICNGATDNAAGVGAALAVGRWVAELTDRPARSLILAFWDREEDGLLGSRHYVANPLVPLADTAAYVNFDIQGANLLPSLRSTSFAIGAETGGATLGGLVDDAVGAATLDTRRLSAIFGQGRSDYQIFIGASVPTVFFSDSTGPCYHTAQDEIGVVDFRKLFVQSRIAYRLTLDLLTMSTPPTFVSGTPLATFADAVTLNEIANHATADLGRFTPDQQAQALAFQATMNAIVAAGAASFDADDLNAMLVGTVGIVTLLTNGECDGFLTP